MSGKSIVEFFAEHEGYKCGYCGSKDTNYSRGMWAHTMTVQDYQDLIDRGWRRSGKYIYKPTLQKTCCPLYTIKCDAISYRMNKSHKKIIKTVNKYLNENIKRGDISTTDQIEMEANNATTETPDGSKQQKVESAGVTDDNKPEKTVPKKGVGADPDKPKCKKAKQRRMERKMKKLTETKEQPDTSKESSKKAIEGKSLDEFLNHVIDNPAHRLEIKLLQSSPQSEEFEKSLEESYLVYQKYQMCVHGDAPEECDKSSYLNFLVNSPLEPENSSEAPSSSSSSDSGFGSFHQHYILDGKIIAVGVIDILPNCVSSVYLYYDPDYSFLSLGTYSALRELSFCKQLHRVHPSIKYYYMGFYVHSCPKMRYKAQYCPSFLVCPESYNWIPIEKCMPKLDKSRYVRFSDADARDEDGDIDLSKVLILTRRQVMPYSFYQAIRHGSSDEEEVMQYATLTGKSCAERMLLYRS